MRRDTGTAAPGVGTIYDVVVKPRGGVQELDRGRDLDRAWPAVATQPRGEQQQQRAQQEQQLRQQEKVPNRKKYND